MLIFETDLNPDKEGTDQPKRVELRYCETVNYVTTNLLKSKYLSKCIH